MKYKTIEDLYNDVKNGNIDKLYDALSDRDKTVDRLQILLDNRQAVIDRYANKRLEELYQSVMNGQPMCRTRADVMTPEEHQNILRETLAERLHIVSEHASQLLERSMHGVCKFATAYHELDEDDKDYLRAEVDAMLKIASMMPNTLDGGELK